MKNKVQASLYKTVPEVAQQAQKIFDFHVVAVFIHLIKSSAFQPKTTGTNAVIEK